MYSFQHLNTSRVEVSYQRTLHPCISLNPCLWPASEKWPSTERDLPGISILSLPVSLWADQTDLNPLCGFHNDGYAKHCPQCDHRDAYSPRNIHRTWKEFVWFLLIPWFRVNHVSVGSIIQKLRIPAWGCSHILAFQLRVCELGHNNLRASISPSEQCPQKVQHNSCHEGGMINASKACGVKAQEV